MAAAPTFRRIAILVSCLAVVAAGCAPKRVYGPRGWDSPRGAPGPADARRDGAPADQAAADGAVAIGDEEARRGAMAADIAERFVGSPYETGGITRDGFDCSGFVRWIYHQQGIELPRNSREQARNGPAVDGGGLARGDLVFFGAGRGGGISHVGIYIGGGRFAHAPKRGRFVTIDSLDDPAWGSRFAGATRPAARSPSLSR